MYPNPANDLVKFRKIDANNDQVLSVLIVDTTGRTIYRSKWSPGKQSINWNCGDNPSGLYFYQLTNRKGKTLDSGKIVIRQTEER